MMEQEPEEEQTNQIEPEVAEVEDIEALKEALAEEKTKAESNLTNWQRAQADFINLSGVVSRKGRKSASLPILCLCLAFCQSLMTWSGLLPLFRPV